MIARNLLSTILDEGKTEERGFVREKAIGRRSSLFIVVPKLLKHAFTSFLFGFLGAHLIYISLGYCKCDLAFFCEVSGAFQFICCESFLILEHVAEFLCNVIVQWRGNMLLIIKRVTNYLTILGIYQTNARLVSTIQLYVRRKSTALNCLYVRGKQLVLFIWMLNRFSNLPLLHRFLCSSFDFQDFFFCKSLPVIIRFKFYVGGRFAARCCRYIVLFNPSWVIHLPYWWLETLVVLWRCRSWYASSWDLVNWQRSSIIRSVRWTLSRRWCTTSLIVVGNISTYSYYLFFRINVATSEHGIAKVFAIFIFFFFVLL